MIKVACLLLAAGKSRRMQGANKLLLDLDGRTVLERVATEISRAPFSDFVAVTGYQSDLIERELSLFDFRVVRNADFELGMHSSIRRGLTALPSLTSRSAETGADFFAVCLGDQPFLTNKDYATLIRAASANPKAPLIYPVIDGERGQPVFISMSLRAEVLAHEDDDRGCQYLFKKYGGLAVDLSHSASALAFYDVDTPAAFAHAKAFSDRSASVSDQTNAGEASSFNDIIDRLRSRGEPFAIATVIAVRGSASAKPGSKAVH